MRVKKSLIILSLFVSVADCFHTLSNRYQHCLISVCCATVVALCSSSTGEPPKFMGGGQDVSVFLALGERRIKRKGLSVLPLLFVSVADCFHALSNRCQTLSLSVCCATVEAKSFSSTGEPPKSWGGGGSRYICLSCLRGQVRSGYLAFSFLWLTVSTILHTDSHHHIWCCCAAVVA